MGSEMCIRDSDSTAPVCAQHTNRGWMWGHRRRRASFQPPNVSEYADCAECDTIPSQIVPHVQAAQQTAQGKPRRALDRKGSLDAGMKPARAHTRSKVVI